MWSFLVFFALFFSLEFGAYLGRARQEPLIVMLITIWSSDELAFEMAFGQVIRLLFLWRISVSNARAQLEGSIATVQASHGD